MSVNGILQKSPANASKLSKAADKILAFPRGMWCGKEVRIFGGTTEGVQCKYRDNASFEVAQGCLYLTRIYAFGVLLSATLATGYLGVCIAGLPFLAVGATLKNLAMRTDAVTKLHNQTAELALKQHQHMRKINKAKSRLTSIKLALTNNPNNNDVKRLSRERVKLEKRITKEQGNFEAVSYQLTQFRTTYLQMQQLSR